MSLLSVRPNLLNAMATIEALSKPRGGDRRGKEAHNGQAGCCSRVGDNRSSDVVQYLTSVRADAVLGICRPQIGACLSPGPQRLHVEWCGRIAHRSLNNFQSRLDSEI